MNITVYECHKLNVFTEGTNGPPNIVMQTCLLLTQTKKYVSSISGCYGHELR